MGTPPPKKRGGIVYVSTKKNLRFYFNLTRLFLKRFPVVQLKACGRPMSTAMIVAAAAVLENKVRVQIQTSTFLHAPHAKTQVIIRLFSPTVQDVHTGVPLVPLVSSPFPCVYLSLDYPGGYWWARLQKKRTRPVRIAAVGKAIALLLVMYERLKPRSSTEVKCKKIPGDKTEVSFILLPSPFNSTS